MEVSVICPVYNGEKYLKKLITRIREQEKIDSLEIIVPVSKSNDSSLEEARKYADIVYEVIEFNHAMTRHEAAQKANGKYLIFITQDIMPADNLWLYNLIKDLKGEVIAAFSKQIAYKEHGKIEKLIREFNYPNEKRLCNLKNKKANGRKNIFYSDASSAILREEFFKLGGYDFSVPTNEDVVLANNIIQSGKTFLYQPESKIYHSHKLSLKETYERYKAIGKFEKLYKDKIDFSKTNGEGKKMCKYVIGKLIKEKRYFEILEFGGEITFRLLGYKIGGK